MQSQEPYFYIQVKDATALRHSSVYDGFVIFGSENAHTLNHYNVLYSVNGWEHKKSSWYIKFL